MMYSKIDKEEYDFCFNYAKKLILPGLLDKVNAISENNLLKPGDVIIYSDYPLMFVDSCTIVSDTMPPDPNALFEKFIREVDVEYRIKTEFIDTNEVEWEILREIPNNFQGILFIDPNYHEFWIKNSVIGEGTREKERIAVKVTVKDQLGFTLYEFIFCDRPYVLYDKSVEVALDECLLKLEVKHIISWFYRNRQNISKFEIES